METSQIREEFKQILAGVVNDGVPSEQATEIARVILQEAGKDRRAAMMNQSRQQYRSSRPATPNQKEWLAKLGIAYEDSITSAEASKKLDEAFARGRSANGNRDNK